MRATATIRVEGDAELIRKVVEPEELSLKQGRAICKIEDADEGLTFAIEASDLVALRAITASITKMLVVIEKTAKI